jgi:integrase
MTTTVAAHRAQERWFLGRGLPSVLTQRARLRAIWPCSARFLAFTATSISANRRCESARLASTLEVAHSTKTTPRRLRLAECCPYLRGVPIALVAARLGHADVSFTLRTYVHAQPEALEVAAQLCSADIKRRRLKRSHTRAVTSTSLCDNL